VAHYPRYSNDIAERISVPQFPDLVRKFIYYQLNPDAPAIHDVDISICPPFFDRIHVFNSATCTFYAPNEKGGSMRQIIHCASGWRDGPARHDCVFVENDLKLPGFEGVYVGQVKLLFSFKPHAGAKTLPCALIQWFTAVGDKPCDITGMWMVKPEYDANGERNMSVIHLDSVLRPAHLIPIFGKEHIPHDLHATDSLMAFNGYYVNKFSDYHAYHLAF
jgi:hypothetical protein